VPDRRSTASLAAVLGEVLIHMDARSLAPAVNPSSLVKGADECFDFVAALSQLLNGFCKIRELWLRTPPATGPFRRSAFQYHDRTCQSDQMELERKVIRDGLAGR